MAVTSVFLIISLSYRVVSSNPTLSDRATLNAHCVCDMNGFDRRLDRLVALQIVKKAGGGQGGDVVLASLHSGEARLLGQLMNGEKQRHFVSGLLDVLRIRDAFLHLTITDFAEDEEGVYSCQIHYTDHPADTEPSTWSRELVVNRSLSHAIQTPGFRVWVSQGVHISCEYSDTTDSPDHVKTMTISATERPWSATWCDKGNQTTCTPGLLGFYHRNQRSSAQDRLEVHIPNVTCEHQSQHVCTVTTTSGKTLNSPSIPLQLKNCPQRLQTVCKTASSTVASSTTADGGASSAWFYVAPVIVVVLALACVGTGVFCILRRRRKQPGDKSLNKRSFWRRMNGGFTHTDKNKHRPRSPAEMENDVNGVLENGSRGKSGEDPLLLGKKEKDATLEAVGTSRIEEARLLTKLNDETSSPTETNNASWESDKSMESSPDCAISRNENMSCGGTCDIDKDKAVISRSKSDSSEKSSSSDTSSYIDLSSKMKTPIQASQSSEPGVLV